MPVKLEKRQMARVKPTIQKRVTWADQHPLPNRRPPKKLKGQALEDAIQHVQKEHKYFCPFPDAKDGGLSSLWSFVMLNKDKSEACMHVYEMHFALRRTKRVGES